jgi:hypothetical protein
LQCHIRVVKTFEKRFYLIVVNKVLYIILFLALSFSAQAQVNEQEKLKQLEIERQADKQRAIDRQIDSVAQLIDLERYEEADQKIVAILKSVRSVPSDITFYLGKTSYYLAKYKQSVDWLNKYIQLKGTNGQFSQEAISIKSKAEVELLKERAVESQQAAQVFSKDFDIDCGPAGKVVCPVCHGSTVIIKKTYFGNSYKTCGYCNKVGSLSCEDYNLLLKGQLQPSAN